MNVLVINCGSSSVKYQLLDMDNENVLAQGIAERIGIDGSQIKHKLGNGEKITIKAFYVDTWLPGEGFYY